MNVREFYKWAQDNNCEDYEINVECYKVGKEKTATCCKNLLYELL